MSPTLRIYASSSNTSPLEFFSDPDTLVNTLWDGSPATNSIDVAISHDSHQLTFSTLWPFKARPLPQFINGDYHEGLWDGEVAEFFLLNRETGQYQEFHLAPGGKWWTFAFSGPRIRVKDFIKPNVEIDYQENASSWSMNLIIEKRELYLPFERITHGNVAAYLGFNNRQLLSKARLPGLTANFHQPDAFLPVIIDDLL